MGTLDAPTSLHAIHRSPGIPTTFPLQVNTLTVNGVAQSSAVPAGRGLRDFVAGSGYPSPDIQHQQRREESRRDHLQRGARRSRRRRAPKVRIYTIGMGQLVPLLLGTRPESSESILRRIANDTVANGNPDFNANQLQGAYYYARRRPPTWQRRSRRCRTRSCA